MYRLVLLLGVSALYGDDLALSIRAQTDFGRVELAVAPSLSDALACLQSQAALLPVTAPAGLSLIHFRKGYCTLVEGALSHDAAEDRAAASEFDQAIEAWPAKAKSPVSPALRVLAAIAKLKAGAAVAGNQFPGRDREGLDACPPSVMSAFECGSLLKIGRMWQGWIAGQEDRLADAARIFQEFPDSGWEAWIAARQAFEAHRYAEAAASFEKAALVWNRVGRTPPSVTALFQPVPDVPQTLVQLGQAQLLAGQYPAAIASFDASLKDQPRNAWAIFLRGRAKDAGGQLEGALADYELASRTAFAAVDARFSSGQAHFYRGVRFFRRQEFRRAEEELASALNFDPGPSLRPDVVAWWRMAAVAEGACRSTTGLLEGSLGAVSDLFPKMEARALIRTCRQNAEIAPSFGGAVCYSAAIWDPSTK